MPIVNHWNISTVKPGDILVATVKVMVGGDGKYRIYRCPWPNAEIGRGDLSPQGDRLFRQIWLREIDDEVINKVISDLQATAEFLFPVLRTSEPNNE